MSPVRAAWFLLGLVALGLGMVGAVLPLLPTTPFILVAAFAFARSSDRWHNWLTTHKTFGPLIANWHEHGAISRKAKFLGVGSLAAVLALSVAMKAAPLVIIIQALVVVASSTFLLTRPLPPPEIDRGNEKGRQDASPDL